MRRVDENGIRELPALQHVGRAANLRKLLEHSGRPELRDDHVRRSERLLQRERGFRRGDTRGEAARERPTHQSPHGRTLPGRARRVVTS